MTVLWENGTKQIRGFGELLGRGLSALGQRGLHASSVLLHEKWLLGDFSIEYLKNKAPWKGIQCACHIPEFSTTLETDAWLVESTDAKGGYWGLTVFIVLLPFYVRTLSIQGFLVSIPGTIYRRHWETTAPKAKAPRGRFLGTFKPETSLLCLERSSGRVAG